MVEAMQPGFTISGHAGGKAIDMHWNSAEQSLVNATERILIERRDITGADGKVTGAENIAYAWHEDPAQRERVAYDKATEKWYQWDTAINAYIENEEHLKREWLPATQTWSYDL